MNKLARCRKISLLFLIGFTNFLLAQSPYQFTLSQTVEECTTANASLEITGTVQADNVSVNWSNGQSNVTGVSNLTAGGHFVQVKITHALDTVINSRDTTLLFIKDTTINFVIDKKQCKIIVPKYFSPNGDNYSDILTIGNIEKYPDFELSIFNKWGQRVHHQQSTYTPWNGTWLGINLPDATYYFVFFYEVSDKKNLVKGDITILR